MNKTIHTPLPTQIELSIGSEGTEYKNEDGEPIETQAVLFDGDSGTIAYVLTDLTAWREIAQALHDRYNSHDRLVEALFEADKLLAYDDDTQADDLRGNIDSTRKYINALLAELEGGA